MRSLPARAWPFVLAAAALGGQPAALWAQPGPERPLFAPGPEVPGAAARGAADVTAAQKLARTGHVPEAVALLEKLAAAQPSVVHDCNLSLAYLRAGKLTEAQLVWDVSQLRGVAAPDWCGPSLSGQLASALRDRHFVPLAVQVTPADATIEVGGVRLRELNFVWLSPGTYTVTARSPGFRDAARPVLVAAPSAAARIDLEDLAAPPPPPEDRDPPDAGVEPPPVDRDAGAPAVDAAPAPIAIEVPPPRPGRARWPAIAGVGVGAIGVGLGAYFHHRALDTKDRADALLAGSTAFADERATFGRQRALALTGYAVGTAALGFAAWWWLTAPAAGRPAVGVAIEPGGAAITVTGTLDGALAGGWR